MSTAVHHSRRSRGADPSYLALVREWPLRPIRTIADYEAAGSILDQLVLRKDLDRGERDYLGALELLIEAYDDEEFPETPDERPPHARLKALMESSNTSAADLQRVLGSSQALVSLMLNGKRQLSKSTIAKLAEYFRIDAGYFI